MAYAYIIVSATLKCFHTSLIVQYITPYYTMNSPEFKNYSKLSYKRKENMVASQPLQKNSNMLSYKSALHSRMFFSFHS